MEEFNVSFSEKGAQFNAGFGELAIVTKEDCGAIDPEAIKQAVDDYLVENPPAKGADGKDGDPGKDGYTPQKGVDYFTPDEIQEVAEQAAQMVDVPEGGGGGMKLLVDYTTEVETCNPEINSIYIGKDMDGKDFFEKNLLVRVAGKVINTTDNDAAIRFVFGSKDATMEWLTPYCKPINSTFSMLLIVSVDDSGVVYAQAPLTSSTVTSKTIDTNASKQITEFSRLVISSNNYNKTHIAAGANIKIWGW